MAKKRVATKKEKEWMRKVSELGCYACDISTGYWTIAEVHHIRKHTGMGLRPSHFDILPLCSVHHRTGKISVHLGKQAFIEKYGTEQELQQRVRERIKKWNEIVDIF